ncbi:hypothetical protein BDV93DRAFT_519445 [Ceratobasidium sp. AG-I]|nr:hypothetical protein BDV93DRAFT_519445 [Ceratobasidium sp. AG-I]
MHLTRSLFFVLVASAGTANALWCCCDKNIGSISCCQNVMGGVSFYSPKCSINPTNGDTCDVGPITERIEEFKACCLQGYGAGRCF